MYYANPINNSTYRIIHHDSYGEFPFIYIKLCPDIPLAVVIDTGVGSQNGADGTHPQELKDFIDTTILPLHPPSHTGRAYEYMVFCTHIHYDHIGGITPFSSSAAEIIASSHNKSFLAPDNRDHNSLCSRHGTTLPQYNISYFADDGERLRHRGRELGLVALHVPGHTPDSLAVYDESENWIFVGDVLYQRISDMPWGETQDEPIILVEASNWTDWVAGLHKLRDFVASTEERMGKHMRLSAGHTSSGVDARSFVQDAIEFVDRVVTGQVPERASASFNGTRILWQDEGEPLFSLLAPARFKKDFGGRRP